MRRLALLTTLVLSGSAVAQADPDPRHDGDARDAQGDRGDGDRQQHRRQARDYHARRFEDRQRSRNFRRQVGGWETLASDSAYDGVQTIGLAQTGAIYGRLRLQAAQGRPFIRRIELLYLDGTRQVLEPHRALNANGTNTTIDFDLDAGDRPLRQITVYSTPSRWSRYELMALEF